MLIEVMGSGCAKCKRLEQNVQRAVKELGLKATVKKVEDVSEMMERGVMMTPALYIEGEPMVTGRVPSVDEIKELLGDRP